MDSMHDPFWCPVCQEKYGSRRPRDRVVLVCVAIALTLLILIAVWAFR